MHTPRTAFQGIPLGRAALWLGLAVWTVSLLRTPLPALGGSFFHLINLVFHEAGHVVFAPFGSFMMSLGGSLLQVIVPLMCAWAFLFSRTIRSAHRCASGGRAKACSISSPYIDDARSLQLMLLGGPAAEVEGHDWEAILMALGWLHLDHTIARAHGTSARPRCSARWSMRFSFFALRFRRTTLERWSLTAFPPAPASATCI